MMMSSLLRFLLRTTTGRALVVLVTFAVAWNLWLTLQAGPKLEPSVREAAASGEPQDVFVVLNFPPERFHTLIMQRYGRVAQSSDDGIDLRGVKSDDLFRLARYYWVREVRPAEAGG